MFTKNAGFLQVGRAKHSFLKAHVLRQPTFADQLFRCGLESPRLCTNLPQKIKILPDSNKAHGPKAHKLWLWKQANG